MLPYLVLLFLPAACTFVQFAKRDGRTIIKVGSSREIIENNCALPVFFILLTVLLSLRHETIGRDTLNYKYYFSVISNLDLRSVFDTDMEQLYVLLNWVVGKLTSEFQIFLMIAAVISIVPVAVNYCREREHSFLKIILFMNMSVFIMMFSGLRQTIAVSLGMIAYEYVKERKPIRFLILCAIALGFHHSSFILLLMYPLYHTSFQKKHLWFLIPALVLIFVFNQQIFLTVSRVLTMLFGEKYDAEIEMTGAYTMLILYVLFAVMSYVLPDEGKLDKETLGLRNILLMTVVLQSFAPVHMLAMRMNYYYMIFMPMLIPRILKRSKARYAGLTPWISGGIIAVLTAYYLYTTYVSCQTGLSAMNNYPYIPFWK